jgi:hypothetical protein
MKAVKAIYDKGKIELSEELAEQGPVEVLVVFPEPADDSWEAILAEATPRPAFLKYVQECEDEIRNGKAKPLNLDDL